MINIFSSHLFSGWRRFWFRSRRTGSMQQRRLDEPRDWPVSPEFQGAGV
jgi:hypothetical protein